VHRKPLAGVADDAQPQVNERGDRLTAIALVVHRCVFVYCVPQLTGLLSEPQSAEGVVTTFQRDAPGMDE